MLSGMVLSGASWGDSTEKSRGPLVGWPLSLTRSRVHAPGARDLEALARQQLLAHQARRRGRLAIGQTGRAAQTIREAKPVGLAAAAHLVIPGIQGGDMRVVTWRRFIEKAQ